METVKMKNNSENTRHTHKKKCKNLKKQERGREAETQKNPGWNVGETNHQNNNNNERKKYENQNDDRKQSQQFNKQN